MAPQPSTYTPNDPGNVPKVLQNRPQTASRKDFSTPSKPYQKERQATIKFHQPSFPKQPIRHTPPLQLTAQQTEKARSNGQKAQKARFHRRNTEAGGSRKANGNRFLSEKDMYAEKQTSRCTTRFSRLPTAVQANRHHLTRHPPATRYLFGQMVQCAASAIAARCVSGGRWRPFPSCPFPLAGKPFFSSKSSLPCGNKTAPFRVIKVRCSG